jgi:hypothetical protein
MEAAGLTGIALFWLRDKGRSKNCNQRILGSGAVKCELCKLLGATSTVGTANRFASDPVLEFTLFRTSDPSDRNR